MTRVCPVKSLQSEASFHTRSHPSGDGKILIQRDVGVGPSAFALGLIVESQGTCRTWVLAGRYEIKVSAVGSR